NEAGVVGGNTAIYTRSLQVARDESPGLTGMDLLRLGLERGRSAEEVVLAITGLLEKYGQWGSAVQGQDHDQGSYENAFMIADGKEAWVLETSGRRWVTERIDSGIRSLSNEPTIRTRWTNASPDLKKFAQQNTWWKESDGKFDFALAYGDHEHYSRQVSHIRVMQSRSLLRQNKGKIDVSAMMKFLRNHYEDTFLAGPQFHQFLPDFLTICMHDSPAGFTWGNTATSVIVELDAKDVNRNPFWLCYLPPCSGIYLAYFISKGIPKPVLRAGKQGLHVLSPAEAPKDQFSKSSLWWRFHRLIEEISKEPEKRYQEVRTLLDPVEREFRLYVENLFYNPASIEQNQLDNLMHDQVAKTLEVLEKIEHGWNLA
ncbi:MAG: C69 family dipeptidase, partial [bacterium]